MLKQGVHSNIGLQFTNEHFLSLVGFRFDNVTDVIGCGWGMSARKLSLSGCQHNRGVSVLVAS